MVKNEAHQDIRDLTDPPAKASAVSGEVVRVALSLWAQRETRRVVGELANARVPVMLLKGPDLQARLYGTPAAYTSGDVDLLVPRDRSGLARRVLERRGWRFSRGNGVLWQLSRAASFDREGFRVDLHWGLHAAHLPAWSLSSLERRLWRGARPTSGGMLEPDAESLLVFLAVHVVGHRFERPQWSENVHRAANLVDDWDEVWRIARHAHVSVAVQAALEGDARQRVVLDGAVGRLVSRVTWFTRGHFLPRSLRASIRDSVALGREGFGYLGLSKRVRTVGGLELLVPAGVFRPWALTEELAVVALAELRTSQPHPIVLDVGTGSGAAALIVASERRDARVHGIDVSARAIRAARKNARSTNLPTVRFHVGRLLDQVPMTMRQRVDFVIANLPTDPRSAPTRAGGGEPPGTLIGQGLDGLGLLRELADQAWSVLRPGGTLVVTTFDWQGDLFAEELRALGYETVEERPSSVAGFRFLRATRT